MRLKKSLGQNFLIDPNYQRKILEAVSLGPHQLILEIGPGGGALTEGLLKLADSLWIVEKDFKLAQKWKERFVGDAKIKVVEGDFLDVDLSTFLGSVPFPLTVVGNLPYNAASPILIKLLTHRHYFSHLYLMFQKEVALRIVAKPGTKDYSLLTLWAQIYADCRILFHLPPGVFKPPPKVTSSFVHFRIRKEALLPAEEVPAFWELMRLLFQKRRKTIVSVLKTAGISLETIERLNLRKKRAEEMSIQELIDLSRLLKK